jgi:pimeloyl-ACP methyl ester carboxylesterase
LLVVLAWLTGVAGCAVLDRNTPGWTSYTSPDADHDLKLHYRIKGQGSPVLLIHGFGASSYSWRHIVDPLSQHHRVVTVDLKGFGDSPMPRDDMYSVYDQARLVRNFILDQDLQDIQIVGHSFGGGVALATSIYLMESHPGLQTGLVLIDSIAYPQELPGFIELLATPVLGPAIVYLVPNSTQVRSLLEDVYFDDSLITVEAVEHYAESLRRENAKYALLTTAKQVLPADIDRFSSQYMNIDIPALIIWGKDDEIIPLAVGERLHNDLPDSRMVVLQSTGHAPQEERPSLVLPYLVDFLGDE